ncbi:LysE family translocator [Methylophilus sp. 'Pure River']|uniref:LysE family translocator n=1 Tax=Methylophilus sp. 'Pure River' TaxID=3377117 RepID=UPI00398F597E
MSEFFFSALSFGLAAGLKPGPLGVIVIQQTLAKGLLSGFRASLAPLITDGPIIIAALCLLSNFKSIHLFVALLSLVGGVYLIWLARKILAIKEILLAGKLSTESSILQAVKVNLLNPSPYLFWFTVGGAYILRGSALESTVFVSTAILTLIASKFAMALLAAFFRPVLESRGYLLVMKALGLSMVFFGMASICQAYVLLQTSGSSF